MNNDKNHRFDLPPFELGRMACGVNAIIEVFNLQTPKIVNCSASEIVSTVVQITNKTLSPPYDLGFISILIQGIIDEKCSNQEDRDRVMNICSRNYEHLQLNRQLI